MPPKKIFHRRPHLNSHSRPNTNNSNPRYNSHSNTHTRPYPHHHPRHPAPHASHLHPLPSKPASCLPFNKQPTQSNFKLHFVLPNVKLAHQQKLDALFSQIRFRVSKIGTPQAIQIIERRRNFLDIAVGMKFDSEAVDYLHYRKKKVRLMDSGGSLYECVPLVCKGFFGYLRGIGKEARARVCTRENLHYERKMGEKRFREKVRAERVREKEREERERRREREKDREMERERERQRENEREKEKQWAIEREKQKERQKQRQRQWQRQRQRQRQKQRQKALAKQKEIKDKQAKQKQIKEKQKMNQLKQKETKQKQQPVKPPKQKSLPPNRTTSRQRSRNPPTTTQPRPHSRSPHSKNPPPKTHPIDPHPPSLPTRKNSSSHHPHPPTTPSTPRPSTHSRLLLAGIPLTLDYKLIDDLLYDQGYSVDKMLWLNKNSIDLLEVKLTSPHHYQKLSHSGLKLNNNPVTVLHITEYDNDQTIATKLMDYQVRVEFFKPKSGGEVMEVLGKYGEVVDCVEDRGSERVFYVTYGRKIAATGILVARDPEFQSFLDKDVLPVRRRSEGGGKRREQGDREGNRDTREGRDSYREKQTANHGRQRERERQRERQKDRHRERQPIVKYSHPSDRPPQRH